MNTRPNSDFAFEDFDWLEHEAKESGRSRLMALAGPLAVLVLFDIALGLAFLVRESIVQGGIAIWFQQSKLPGPELIATVVVVASLALFISMVVHVAVASRDASPEVKSGVKRSITIRAQSGRRRTYW